MPESGAYGSVRGALSNERPYRDPSAASLHSTSFGHSNVFIVFVPILLIVFAAILLVVTLLEVFLSDAKKARINDFTLRLWNWLDDLKARRLLDLLQARGFWLLGTGVLLAVAFIFRAELRALRNEPFGIMDIIFSCVVFGPGIWFGVRAARWTLRATTPLLGRSEGHLFPLCRSSSSLFVFRNREDICVADLAISSNFKPNTWYSANSVITFIF